MYYLLIKEEQQREFYMDAWGVKEKSLSVISLGKPLVIIAVCLYSHPETLMPAFCRIIDDFPSAPTSHCPCISSSLDNCTLTPDSFVVISVIVAGAKIFRKLISSND